MKSCSRLQCRFKLIIILNSFNEKQCRCSLTKSYGRGPREIRQEQPPRLLQLPVQYAYNERHTCELSALLPIWVTVPLLHNRTYCTFIKESVSCKPNESDESTGLYASYELRVSSFFIIEYMHFSTPFVFVL